MIAPTESKLPGRFWRKVEPQESGCWSWTGFRMKNGYGRTSGPVGPDGKYPSLLVHRMVYADLVGEIPEGLTVDHGCHDSAICQLGDACPHRSCVRPAHLRAMESVENSQRQWEQRTAVFQDLKDGVMPLVSRMRAEGSSWFDVSVAVWIATDQRVTPETLRTWHIKENAA